jgi:hypothetical protein
VSGDKQTGCLVLAPHPECGPPGRERVLDFLRASGFVGEPFSGADAEGFLIGESFLQLITFMGCSPHIELSPPADGASFCHVRLHGPLDAPRLLAGRNAQPPRCASCRGRIEPWREVLQDWRRQPAASSVSCPRCGQRQRPMDLDWRRQGGCARLLLEVADVFPGEAVPVPSLMQGLETLGAGPWRYFYYLAR